jgi:hypothetical protein
MAKKKTKTSMKVPKTVKAKRKIKKVMHEFKKGTLKMGRSGKRVVKRTQAVAIGLSQARKTNKK